MRIYPPLPHDYKDTVEQIHKRLVEHFGDSSVEFYSQQVTRYINKSLTANIGGCDIGVAFIGEESSDAPEVGRRYSEDE